MDYIDWYAPQYNLHNMMLQPYDYIISDWHVFENNASNTAVFVGTTSGRYGLLDNLTFVAGHEDIFSNSTVVSKKSAQFFTAFGLGVICTIALLYVYKCCMWWCNKKKL
jgi:uncharacterized membrane protein YukC